MSAPAPPLMPTTGEPISTIARRGRVGLWLMIVADVSGTIALIISYSYLWSLNVNGGWAPPGAVETSGETNNPLTQTGSFAAEWPFWAILLLVALSTAAMWWSYKAVKGGFQAAGVTAAVLSALVMIGALVAQWIQISTFPFGPTEGAYASAVILLCASNLFHMLLVLFILIGIVNRTRKGLIRQNVNYQSQAASYYMTWVSIAVLLGALVTTFMVESPNTDPSKFGHFTTLSESTASPSPSPSSSASPSGSASPSASPSSTPSSS